MKMTYFDYTCKCHANLNKIWYLGLGKAKQQSLKICYKHGRKTKIDTAVNYVCTVTHSYHGLICVVVSPPRAYCSQFNESAWISSSQRKPVEWQPNLCVMWSK